MFRRLTAEQAIARADAALFSAGLTTYSLLRKKHDEVQADNDALNRTSRNSHLHWSIEKQSLIQELQMVRLKLAEAQPSDEQLVAAMAKVIRGAL